MCPHFRVTPVGFSARRESCLFEEECIRGALEALVRGSGFGVRGSGFRVQGSGFKVQRSALRVQCSVFRVQGSEFEIQSSGSGFGCGNVGLSPSS